MNYDVVLHLDSNDPAKMRLVLRNAANYLTALAEHGIDPARVWPECEIVPAGLVEVVRLQREGFAYIKP